MQDRSLINEVLTLTLLLLCVLTEVMAQSRNQLAIDVVRIQEDQSVSIDFDVISPREDIVVAACEGANGRESLCNLYVEVEYHKKWQVMQFRHKGAKLGILARDYWNSRVVSAPTTGHFTFKFSKSDFSVESGRRLRLVVNVWTNEQSMRKGDPGIRLLSKPFKCP